MKPLKKKSSGPAAFMSVIKQVENEGPQRAVAEISSSALTGNYRAIQELVPGHQILPMLKSNAYGHGVKWAARLLGNMPGLYAFGVATLDEGAELRSSLGPKGRKTPIVIFSETAPWSDETGWFCEQNGLTAVLSTEADWTLFLKRGWVTKIPYEIQFNTGMNRLGISPNFARSVAKDLKTVSADHHPTGIFSHLAMSESPEANLTQTQLERFRAVRQELCGIVPGAQFHIANSGGVWNTKHFGLKGLTDVVRPGLSLYGIPPWSGAPERGIFPVMTFKARILAIHRLKPGDSIGYGGTYKVSGSAPIFAAILGAGYADGVKRGLSNQGHAWLDGKSTRFLGVVSMDLCAVQCRAETQVGSWAELMGPRVDPWAQALAAGTIPYELLTSVSSRVKRIYDSNS